MLNKMIQSVIFIILCLGLCSSQNFVFIYDTIPEKVYPIINTVRPNASNVQQNTNDMDAIHFVNNPPLNYPVDYRPATQYVPPYQPPPTPLTTRLPQTRPTTRLPQTRPTTRLPQPFQNAPSYRPTQGPPQIAITTNQSTNTQNTITSAISYGIYNLGQQILFRALENRGPNIFKSEVISPLSIAGVGYLLYLGSAGQTENELTTLLGLNRGTNQKQIHQQFGLLLDDIVHDHEIPNEKKEYPELTVNRVHQISVANGLFLNQYFDLRRQYENVARDTYKSEVKQMNFAGQGYEAKRYIDGWVSNKTHGKIANILPEPPNGDTQMIVVSALYFKALWWEELGVAHVTELPFYPNGVRYPAVEVETILFTSEFLPFYKSVEMNCQIFGLKYQKQLSTIYIVQPLESNRETLRQLQAQLSAEKLDFLISRMVPTYASLLAIPKFHLQNEIDLKVIFQQMGVRSLFGNANLSPITRSRNEYPNQSASNINDLDYLDAVRKSNISGSGISISQIYHKVDLVVNEKGTEGGAATAAFGDKISGNTFKVDTPFLFVVRQDYTRLPLFYGVVFEPEQD